MYNKDLDSYKVHQIICEIIKRSLPLSLEVAEPLIDSITDLLSIDQAQDNPIDKFEWIPFGIALRNHFKDSDAPLITILQNNLALVLKALGDYSRAKELLEKAYRVFLNALGDEHPTTRIIKGNLEYVTQQKYGRDSGQTGHLFVVKD